MRPIARTTSPKNTLRATIAVALWSVSSLVFNACDGQSARNAPPAPVKVASVFAPPELEQYVFAAERDLRSQGEEWRLNIELGGAQVNASRIDDSAAPPDVFIAADRTTISGLDARPDDVIPWLANPLTVIASPDAPDDVDLLTSDEPLAMGGVSSPLGEYTRLALRVAQAWQDVEERTTQRIRPDEIVDAVRSGEAELGIVYATDIPNDGSVKTIRTLDLPEGVEVVYTIATFSENGRRIAQALCAPDILGLARSHGYQTLAAPSERQPTTPSDSNLQSDSDRD